MLKWTDVGESVFLYLQLNSESYFILDEMHIARQKSRSDAEFYQLQKQAEANKLLLTREYLELTKYRSLTTNSKIYFGPDIPNMFVQGDKASASSGSFVDSAASAQEALGTQESPTAAWRAGVHCSVSSTYVRTMFLLLK